MVVYSLSRLARSTKDTLAIAERLDKAGCDMASLSEKIDTSTAAGKMVFRMLSVLSEFERDQISERTSAALAHKASKGERVSRYAPFGYDFTPDGHRLVENETEQEIIGMILELRSAGLSYRKIGRALEGKGIMPKRAKRWSATVLRAVVLRHAA